MEDDTNEPAHVEKYLSVCMCLLYQMTNYKYDTVC